MVYKLVVACSHGAKGVYLSEQEFITSLEAKISHDAEMLAGFRLTLAEKRKIPGYSIFEDFPRDEKPLSERAKMNLFYSRNILLELRSKK